MLLAPKIYSSLWCDSFASTLSPHRLHMFSAPGRQNKNNKTFLEWQPACSYYPNLLRCWNAGILLDWGWITTRLSEDPKWIPNKDNLLERTRPPWVPPLTTEPVTSSINRKKESKVSWSHLNGLPWQPCHRSTTAMFSPQPFTARYSHHRNRVNVSTRRSLNPGLSKKRRENNHY